MPIDFIPSPTIAVSLLAVALLPLWLLALSHRPLRIASPGRRFVAATMATWFTWLVLLLLPEASGTVDLIAGALLLATATLAGFTFWTLVAWGFTVSMLVALRRADRPLTLDGWIHSYTRGEPISAFARNRLGVLLALGLAAPRDSRVVMTPVRGRLFAIVATSLRRLFGLTT